MINGMVTIDPAQEAAAKKNAADDSAVTQQVADLVKTAIPADLPTEAGSYVLLVEGKKDELTYSWVQLKQ